MMRKYLAAMYLVCMSLSTAAQVDLPTGKAVFTLPLIKYSDGNRLNFTAQLNYTAGGGVLVNEIPTPVGLGWALECGGKIVRSTAGEPDDQVAGVYAGEQYGPGFLYSPYDNLSPLPLKAGYVPLYPFTLEYYRQDSSVIADREQDNFIFDFCGRKGAFVIDRFGNIQTLDDSRLRIEKLEKDMLSSNIITAISGFIVTDENGIRYTFTELETGNVINNQKGPRLTTSSGQNLSTQNYRISDYSVVNAWNLTEIADPLSKSTISFTYEGYKLQYQQAYEAVYTESVVEGKQENVTQTLQIFSSEQKKRISGIALPQGNNIGFKYADIDMVDLPGQKPLQQLTLSNNGQIVYGYKFGYNYFLKDSLRDYNYPFSPAEIKDARLCLRSIQKTGKLGITEPPYKFDYITKVAGILMPGRMLGGQDHFGYFNNSILAPDYSTTDKTYTSAKVLTMPVNREVSSFGAAQIGALKSIQYPAGGTLSYEYENNTANFNGTQVFSGGIRVSQTVQYDGIDTTRKIFRQYKYIKEDLTTSGWGYEPPQYNDTSTNYFVIPNSSSPYSAASMSYSIANGTAGQIFGSGMVNFYQIASTLAYNTFLTVIITVISSIFNPPAATKQLMVPVWQQISNHPSKYNTLPHLYSRVEEISGNQQDNNGKTVYEFTSPAEFPIQLPVQKSPFIGRRCVPWLYGLPTRITTFRKSGTPVSKYTNTYKAYASETGSSGSYSVRYKANQVLICPENLYNTYAPVGIKLITDYAYILSGRIELTSTESQNFDSSGSYSTTAKTIYSYDPYFKQPKTITTFNSRYDTITEKIYYPNDYTDNSFQVAGNLKERNIINLPIARETWISTPQGTKLIDASSSYLSAQPSGDIKVEKMLALQTSAPLSLTEAATFNGSTFNRIPDLLQTRQALVYDDAGKLTATYQEQKTSGFQYDSSNKVVAITQNASAAHLVSTDMTPLVSGTITSNGNEYKTFNITLNNPGAIALDLVVPVDHSRSCTYSIQGPVVKSGLLAKVNSPGKLSEVWNGYKGISPSVCFGRLPAGTYTIALHNFIWNPQPSDPQITVNYSYSQQPLVTKPAEFFYNGFEDSSFELSSSSFAGKKYNPGPYKIPFSAPNTRSYLVDYRYLQGSTWRYNRKPFNNLMTLTDGQAIDEVRVYPSDAQITTYTYEPLVGVTSENGTNGIIVFYEYDNLGRLSFVRDENRNILKRICYNYAGEAETCGGQSYNNAALQRKFTRQNCNIGFTAGDYLYQVPAGKYTADDQSTADAQAIADLQKNGQAAANQFGSCTCAGEDRAIIGNRCEKGNKESFIDTVEGGTKCRQGYWYRFSDGSHSAKIYGAYVVCP